MGVGRTWTDGEDGATHTAGREIVLHAGADATAKEAGVVAAGSRVAVEACVWPCAVPKFRSDSPALCAFRELGGGSGATRLRCTVIGEGGVRGLSGWANAEGSEHTDVSARLSPQRSMRSFRSLSALLFSAVPFGMRAALALGPSPSKPQHAAASGLTLAAAAQLIPLPAAPQPHISGAKSSGSPRGSPRLVRSSDWVERPGSTTEAIGSRRPAPFVGGHSEWLGGGYSPGRYSTRVIGISPPPRALVSAALILP